MTAPTLQPDFPTRHTYSANQQSCKITLQVEAHDPHLECKALVARIMVHISLASSSSDQIKLSSFG